MNIFGAVVIGSSLLASGAFAQDAEKNGSVELICALRSDGEYVLTNYRPDDKSYGQTRVSFENSVPVSLKISYAFDSKRTYKTVFDFDLKTERDATKLKFAEIMMRPINAARAACIGTKEDKDRYFETMKANRAKFGIR